jgi:hypothetical protein
MIHVADIELSVEFYRLLGFAVGNRVPPTGKIGWAWLYAPKVPDWRRGPNLMLTLSGSTIDADAQQVLFYLYAANLPLLRDDLLLKGLNPGEICYPDYLPKGEFKLLDPDGYCLMIAQSTSDTP